MQKGPQQRRLGQDKKDSKQEKQASKKSAGHSVKQSLSRAGKRGLN
jgi:hypothetical protein